MQAEILSGYVQGIPRAKEVILSLIHCLPGYPAYLLALAGLLDAKSCSQIPFGGAPTSTG